MPPQTSYGRFKNPIGQGAVDQVRQRRDDKRDLKPRGHHPTLQVGRDFDLKNGHKGCVCERKPEKHQKQHDPQGQGSSHETINCQEQRQKDVARQDGMDARARATPDAHDQSSHHIPCAQGSGEDAQQLFTVIEGEQVGRVEDQRPIHQKVGNGGV